MDKSTTLDILGGKFVFKNILTIGEELQISVKLATFSEGMYGSMASSKNAMERIAAYRLHKMAQLEVRLETFPDDFGGLNNLPGEEFEKLWDAWTEKSGMFPFEKADEGLDSGEGEESTTGGN